MGELPVHGRSGVIATTFVDDADVEWLGQWRWCFNDWRSPHRYVMRATRVGGRVVKTYMHRLILGLERDDPRRGDHIDRDHLNNQRSNLRLATHAENLQNQGSHRGSSSRFRGVDRQPNGWRARARLNGRLHHLGYFPTEDEAAAVAAAWRTKHMTHTIEVT